VEGTVAGSWAPMLPERVTPEPVARFASMMASAEDDRSDDTLPVPPGRDTEILGYLTSVGPNAVHGGGHRAPTIGRLLLRLRIFWFFLLIIPGVVAAFAAIGLGMDVVRAILGPTAFEQAGTAASLVTIAALIALVAAEVKLAAALFDRLTRGYRARLVERARAVERAAAEAAVRPAPRPTTLDDLAALDARLAPPPEQRSRD